MSRGASTPSVSISSSRPSGRRLAPFSGGSLDVAGKPTEAGKRHPAAEPVGGCVLEPVSLVEDDRVVLGQDRRVPPDGTRADGDVGEVERVVRDHELRRSSPLADGLREADGARGALAPEAAIAADGELGP